MIFLFLALQLAKPAAADTAVNTGVVFVGAMTAYSAVGAIAYEGMLPRELPEWRDDATETTAWLVHQCGVSAEMRLIGFPHSNVLVYSIKNESNDALELRAGEIALEFSQGRSRIPNYDVEPGVTEIKPGVRAVGGAPFPSKLDFKEAEWIEVKIPVKADKDCTVSARLKRNPARVPEVESYTERTAIEWVFGGGAPLWRVGSAANLGAPSFNFEGQLEGYWSVRHGWFLNFMIEGYSGGAAAVLSSVNGGLSSPRLTALMVSAGYSHRIPLSDRFFVFLGGGVGLHSLLYDDTNSSGFVVRGQSDSLVVQTRAALAFRFLKLARGFFRGSYYIDLSIYDHILPFGSIENTVPTAGNSLGAMLGLRFGG